MKSVLEIIEELKSISFKDGLSFRVSVVYIQRKYKMNYPQAIKIYEEFKNGVDG